MKSQYPHTELISQLEQHIATLKSQGKNLNWRTVGELEGCTAAVTSTKYAPISGLLYTAHSEQKFAQAGQVAQVKGGKLLSRVYENSRTPLLWQCSNLGHKPFKTFISHAQTHWCRKCHTCQRKRQQPPAHLSALATLMQMDTADMTVRELYSRFQGFNSITVFRSFLERYDIPYSRVFKPMDEPDFNIPVQIPAEQLSYLYMLLNSDAKVKRFTE